MSETTDREKLSVVRELSGSLSHDLNNPLAVILNSVESLVSCLDEPTPDPALLKELARYISVSAQRIAKFSQQMKSLTLQSLSPYELAPRSPRQLVEGAIQCTDHYTRKAGLEVLNQVPADLPEFTVDGAMVEQILINLIRNAYEEMRDRGAGRLELTGRLDAATSRIVLRIRDYGQGLSPKIADRLFVPFTTTKGSGRGAGLGLYTGARLAELHGGGLTYVPQAGPGATFELSLPIKSAG